MPMAPPEKKGFIFYYLSFIVTIGQSVHYIQAYKIFSTKSAEDISLLAYTICAILLTHWLLYGLYIKNKVLILAEFLGLLGCGLVILGVHWYG